VSCPCCSDIGVKRRSLKEGESCYSNFAHPDWEISLHWQKPVFMGFFRNSMIEVRHLSGDQYEVRVTDETPTTHQVTLKEADRVRLVGPEVPGDALIAESFRFLLEREPNTSILRTFDLPVIGTYFPEYERDIRKRVAQR